MNTQKSVTRMCRWVIFEHPKKINNLIKKSYTSSTPQPFKTSKVFIFHFESFKNAIEIKKCKPLNKKIKSNWRNGTFRQP